MGFSELQNAAAVQARLSKGYAKVARQQGLFTGVYRPIDEKDPFSNKIAETYVIYTKSYEFTKPDKFGIPFMLGIFDATGIQQGDYLVTPPIPDSGTYNPDDVFTNTGIVGSTDVFYVSSLMLNTPIMLVECQRTITVSRILGPTGANGATKGVLSYSGAKPGLETVLMQDWKAAIVQGTKGENNPTNLPLDMRMPWWIITLPHFPGIIIDTGDVIRDDLGRKYMVCSPELTDMGWRITAAYERA